MSPELLTIIGVLAPILISVLGYVFTKGKAEATVSAKISALEVQQSAHLAQMERENRAQDEIKRLELENLKQSHILELQNLKADMCRNFDQHSEFYKRHDASEKTLERLTVIQEQTQKGFDELKQEIRALNLYKN